MWNAHPRLVRTLEGLLLSLGFLSVLCAGAGAAEVRGFAMVSAHTYEGYTRTIQADGSYVPETYAFGNGGRWDIAMVDKTIDDLSFIEIGRTIAGPLADQGYLPAKDPRSTKLLIVVYWGTSSGSAEAPQFKIPTMTGNYVVGAMAEVNDTLNARMLGFEMPNRADSFKHDPLNLLEEVEANRYFVGLVAYDFQALWRHKVRKVLWVTRYSIREHRNQFDVALPEMTKYAAQFFGQDSHGFVARKLPEGHVDVGPSKILGTEGER